MNPRTRADIMTLAPEDDTSHPFSYFRILGVFHVDVVHNIPDATKFPTSIEVLWVRRLRRDTTYRAGFKAKRLHRLQFVPGDDPTAFGFLNPDEVIRGVHLIPAFAHGRTHELLTRSLNSDDHGSSSDLFDFEDEEDQLEWRSLALAHEENHDEGEWRYHYVNMFADRDMYMRYVGGGVGHYKVEIAEEPDLPEDLEQVNTDAPEPDLDEDVVQPEPVIQDMPGDDDHSEPVQYSANHPFLLSTWLSTLVVESGSLGRKREWEAWLQLHHAPSFRILEFQWTPSPDLSIPSHSPPSSPPLWSKAGVWVERESIIQRSTYRREWHWQRVAYGRLNTGDSEAMTSGEQCKNE
ncbi:hypothetical protein B0H14DRAFT_3857221 [Mycena olivaceomarginata]|nr:hypothetical protein B0H14DRAFT_3857221 [Mycena olivaceomarginata]